MRRFIALLVCGLASTAPLAAQTDSTAAGTNPLERARAAVERFKLFTGCAQVRLTVALSGETGEKIGLTEERVRTLVESRLRAARLYLSEGTLRGVIIVGVNTLRRGTAFKPDTCAGVAPRAWGRIGGDFPLSERLFAMARRHCGQPRGPNR